MDLHPGEEIVFEGRPVWRSILSFYLTGLVGAIVVGVIVGIAVSTALGIVAWLVLFSLVLLVGFIRRIETRYTITNQRLRIQRGLLSKSVQQTRIERVQNVNTHQTVFDRLLRVGKVDFDTAGTDDSDFTFAGVGSPHRVVEAVDRAQRESGERFHRENPTDYTREGL
jgi:uncharacterized membrane protein YdbT with pleckstrin-like domain